MELKKNGFEEDGRSLETERPTVEDFLADTFGSGDQRLERRNSAPEKLELRNRVLPVGAKVEVGISIRGETIHLSGTVNGMRESEIYDIRLADGSTMEGIKRCNLYNVVVPHVEELDYSEEEEERKDEEPRYQRSQTMPVTERKKSSLFQSIFCRFKKRKNKTVHYHKPAARNSGVHVDDHIPETIESGSGDGELLLSVMPPPMTTIDFFDDEPTAVVTPEVATAGPTATTTARQPCTRTETSSTNQNEDKTDSDDDSLSSLTTIRNEATRIEEGVNEDEDFGTKEDPRENPTHVIRKSFSLNKEDQINEPPPPSVQEEPEEEPAPTPMILPTEEDTNFRRPDGRSGTSRVVLHCNL